MKAPADMARLLRESNPVPEEAFAGAAGDSLGRATFKRITTSSRRPAPVTARSPQARRRFVMAAGLGRRVLAAAAAAALLVISFGQPKRIRPLRTPPSGRRNRAVRWLAPAAAAAATVGLIAGVTAAGHAARSGSSSAAVKGAVARLAYSQGEAPSCIFPLEPSDCASPANYQDFQYLMVRPLYMFGGNNDSVTVNYPLSPADPPAYRDGGRTVVINIKPWKWSNGQTVDARDLIFFLNMLEAEKVNYAGYTPGLLPDNIASYEATGPQQVTLHLRAAFSSIWYTYNQLAILYPFPLTWDVTHAGAAAGSGGCQSDSAADHWARCVAVWNYLNRQNTDVATYGTNPLWRVVDGPFRLSSFVTSSYGHYTNSYTFVPNRKYSGSPKPSISKLTFTEYASATAIYRGLKKGALSQGQVPTSDLRPAGKNFLPPGNPLASTPDGGYNLQAALSFAIGFSYVNFNNPAYGPVFRQLYFRQALQMLDFQPGMNTAVGRGYSVSTVAGVPSEPPSQWISPVMREHGGQGPYPYDPVKAKALLASHGWKIAGGVLTCQRAGTGADDCGAGIPQGRQAKFAMLYTSGITTQQDEVNILKDGFGEAGITLTPEAESFNTLLADTVPCSPSQASCKWTFLYVGGWDFSFPGFEPSGEPLFQTGVPDNAGSYSNPEMDALINATHLSNSLSTFYAYANYSAEQVPSLWMPSPVTIEAVSRHLHHASQSPLNSFYPEYWTCGAKSC
jgi:peptide/nickel transport system substrate-binding protein